MAIDRLCCTISLVLPAHQVPLALQVSRSISDQNNLGYNSLVCIVGKDGMNGINGINGVDGKDGTDGAQGPVGPTGGQGLTGREINARLIFFIFRYNKSFNSNMNFSGRKGNDGTTGSLGIQGATGPTGPHGHQGIQGPAGLQGVQGVKGKKKLPDIVDTAYNDWFNY